MDISLEIIKLCLCNYTKLLIVFNKNINYNLTKSKILNPNNYYLISKHSSLPLSSLISSIYCYNNNFISFNLKDDSYKILKEYNKIKFESSYLKNNSTPQINKLSIISFIEKENIESLFDNCESFIEESYSLKIINTNIIPYYRVYKDDFYILVNENKFYPSEIFHEDENTLQINFNNKIISSPLDKVVLFTKMKCKSINALGSKLKANDSIEVSNLLKTTVKNISINSYINNTLTLAVEFTSEILRYDSKDFIVHINNKYYPCTGHSSFTDNLIKLTIDNIFNLDFQNDLITLKVIETSYIYTLDSRYLPISNSNYKKAKYFLALNGELISIPILNLLKLNVFFNKKIKNITKTQSFGYLNISDNKEILTLSITDIGKLQIYGTDLNISNSNIEYKLSINSECNTLEFSIDTTNFNFINENKDKIKYIDFLPSEYLSSADSTLALTSFEAPITFYTEEFISSSPDNYDDSWTLLGKTLDKRSIIFVDSSSPTRDYGNLITHTTFLKDLYIKYTDSNTNYNSIDINLINIKADTVYINLPDNFNLNLYYCDFNNLKLL